MAVCEHCGLEAEVTVTDDTHHSYRSLDYLACRWLQEQARKLGSTPILQGARECPHLAKAVAEEVDAIRGE